MAGDRNDKSRNRVASAPPCKIDFLDRSHLAAMMKIERRCFNHPWSLQSLEGVLTQKTYRTLGAWLPRKVLAGYLIFSEVADELHILNFAVDPKYRQKGIGSHLMEAVHQGAFENGRRKAYLEVRETNQVALRLYEKFGYIKLTKRLNYYEGDQEDAILMSAKIKKVKKRK